MANPVDGMTSAPVTSGFYNYPPQNQLPPSVSVVVNNPPQSLPQINTGGPQDSFATPTAYRPSTDQNIGQALDPAAENVQAAAPVNFSRYDPVVVYPSGIPSYDKRTNGVATDTQDPNLPHDPTESGSR
jgi:hypothetical protein